MPLKVKCPCCDRGVVADDSAVTTRCPDCGVAFPVGTPESPWITPEPNAAPPKRRRFLLWACLLLLAAVAGYAWFALETYYADLNRQAAPVFIPVPFNGPNDGL